jgi:glycosyltransferase involved in cell wall biosynthesis
VNVKHQVVGIVQEHRWELDGASWGGFSHYPINIRKKAFSEFYTHPITELIVAGDQLTRELELLEATAKSIFLRKYLHKIRRKSSSKFSNAGYAERCIKVLREFNAQKPTIIYHQMNSFELPREEFFMLAKDFNIILVSTLVDLQEIYFPEYFDSEMIEKRHTAYKVNFNEAHSILAISDFLVHQAVQNIHVDSTKIIHTPLGADHDSEIFSDPSIRSRIPWDDKYVLFPAKSWSHKGHLGLISEMIRSNSDAKVIFVGNTSSIQSKVASLLKDEPSARNFVFLEYVSNSQMKYLYQNSAALVLPSVYEGFGLPYVEAALEGVPIVAFRNEAVLEILGEDGAQLSDIGDFVSLVQAIKDVLNQDQSQMVARARLRAREFTWKRTAQTTIEGYLLAIENANRNLASRYD